MPCFVPDKVNQPMQFVPCSTISCDIAQGPLIQNLSFSVHTYNGKNENNCLQLLGYFSPALSKLLSDSPLLHCTLPASL